MPPHPDRVRQNYCEHEWKRLFMLSFVCSKCGKIVQPPNNTVIIDHICEVDVDIDRERWNETRRF